jgi:hypothetical protein
MPLTPTLSPLLRRGERELQIKNSVELRLAPNQGRIYSRLPAVFR